MPNLNYEVLSDANAGAVTIIRINQAALYKAFEAKHLSFHSKRKGSLRYANLLLGDYKEDILVIPEPKAELHIHGGQGCLQTTCKALDELNAELTNAPGTSIDDRLQNLWEKTFQQTHSEKGIEYLLRLKASGLSVDQNEDFDMEGYEFLRPLRMSLLGPANAGKSSLFNHLLGQSQALVSQVAGTTRDTLRSRIQLAGHSIELIDTAGFKQDKTESKNEIDAMSEELSKQAASQSDIILAFSPLAEDLKHQASIIQVHSKSDLASDIRPGAIPISTLNNKGIDHLIDAIQTQIKLKKQGRISPIFSRELLTIKT